MKYHVTKNEVFFYIIKAIIMLLAAVSTLYPFINALAVSFNNGLDGLKGGIRANITEKILAQIKHRQCRQDDMHRITHPLEIGFPRQLSGQKWNGRISCCSIGNLSSICGHDKETWLFCRQGKSDKGVCAAFRVCRPYGLPAQIDARICGKDISGSHFYLCHNDKTFDGCYISDSKSGMILS
jgi:hypothetical protein